ncbi:unnamed protein product [Acanthoscelides obtectus]|uniref:Cytochrome b561 domain-containing protein n=1 Tax=Acanthoscelides obtectus TaxID=200917 RepID=A0A9P0MET4_ACAOB|nr:unnamed protein product [Acanthoscelides obtectus]CAK1682395.1 Putative cytochrome b561 [Acanthoscelides obtectus]
MAGNLKMHKTTHRHYQEENQWSCGSWIEYTLVVVLASVLLLGALALTLFWILQYHGGFAWRENPDKQFNLHPVLMVAAILLYRICRCCRRIYVKLLHTVFHALAIPCVAVGFLAVLDSHNLKQPNPIPNFYSLHSWIGLVCMGLFAIQFVVGFFSFLVLLCCEGATAGFRASLVPIHASFGLTTFILAIAAALTGLTEKVMFTLGSLKNTATLIWTLFILLTVTLHLQKRLYTLILIFPIFLSVVTVNRCSDFQRNEQAPNGAPRASETQQAPPSNGDAPNVNEVTVEEGQERF